MAASYPKIQETDTGWLLEPGALRRLGRAPWVVTEKVHGANLSFLLEAERITLHKRKGPVLPGESFFGSARVLARHETSVRAMAEQLRAEGLDSIQLFGELYGGGYPHPEVKPCLDVQPIQTGVWYCPDVRFVAFDLVSRDAKGACSFLDFDTLHALCKAHGIPVAAPLARGTLSEALAYPLGFDTTLPGALGLPALAGPNLAEGVVVRPAQETLVPTAKGPRRALLKRKLATFAEDLRFHGARPWPEGQRMDPLVAAEREGLARIHANRVQSAISKLGPPTEAGIDKIVAEVLNDVWSELHDQGALALLSREDRELLRAVLDDAAVSALKHGH